MIGVGNREVERRLLFEAERIFLSSLNDSFSSEQLQYAYDRYLDLVEAIGCSREAWWKLLLLLIDQEWVRLSKESLEN